jgi:hypothetical protein
MAFKVWLADQDTPQDCGDAATYEFLTGGVLAVHYSTPGQWSAYYPPGRWTHVSAEPNHVVGDPANLSTGPEFD